MDLFILMLTLDFQMIAHANVAVGMTWAALTLALVTTVVGAVAVGSPLLSTMRDGVGRNCCDVANSDEECPFTVFFSGF